MNGKFEGVELKMKFILCVDVTLNTNPSVIDLQKYRKLTELKSFLSPEWKMCTKKFETIIIDNSCVVELDIDNTVDLESIVNLADKLNVITNQGEECLINILKENKEKLGINYDNGKFRMDFTKTQDNEVELFVEEL